ncbi:MAG: hypothetical protein ABI440_07700 [Casimicrobiaceae bacterium]
MLLSPAKNTAPYFPTADLLMTHSPGVSIGGTASAFDADPPGDDPKYFYAETEWRRWGI